MTHTEVLMQHREPELYRYRVHCQRHILCEPDGPGTPPDPEWVVHRPGALAAQQCLYVTAQPDH